jgi:CRISP-associated protein Cas1
VGKTKRGITIRSRGAKVHEAPLRNLKHIFIISQGVTISSNVIAYCSEQCIPIDFIGYNGMPYTRLYPLYAPDASLQVTQLKATETAAGRHLAKCFVTGKIKNQINLAKYYHKYRKGRDEEFSALFSEKMQGMEDLANEPGRLVDHDLETLRSRLFSIEGRGRRALLGHREGTAG